MMSFHSMPQEIRIAMLFSGICTGLTKISISFKTDKTNLLLYKAQTLDIDFAVIRCDGQWTLLSMVFKVTGQIHRGCAFNGY